MSRTMKGNNQRALVLDAVHANHLYTAGGAQAWDHMLRGYDRIFITSVEKGGLGRQ